MPYGWLEYCRLSPVACRSLININQMKTSSVLKVQSSNWSRVCTDTIHLLKQVSPFEQLAKLLWLIWVCFALVRLYIKLSWLHLRIFNLPNAMQFSQVITVYWREYIINKIPWWSWKHAAWNAQDFVKAVKLDSPFTKCPHLHAWRCYRFLSVKWMECPQLGS